MCADELVCASACVSSVAFHSVLRGGLSLKPELAVLARPAGRLHVFQSWCYT